MRAINGDKAFPFLRECVELTSQSFFFVLEEKIINSKELSIIMINIDNKSELEKRHGYISMESIKEELSCFLRFKALSLFESGDVYFSALGDSRFLILAEKTVSEIKLKSLQKLALIHDYIPKRQNLDGSVRLSLGYRVRSEESNECLDNIVNSVKQSMRSNSVHGNKSNICYLDILQSIESDEIELWYQPKFILSSNTLFGYEALARWRKNGVIIPPDEFLASLQAYSLTEKFNKHVIHLAFKKCREFINKGHDLVVSLNLDAEALSQPTTMDAIYEAKKEFDIPKGRIVIEITEGVVIDKMSPKIEVLKNLREQGFLIAIDDFGTGASNIEYFTYFPADIVKLDKMFFTHWEDPAMLGMIKATVNMAKKNNMLVVIEGIETKVQLKLAKSMGCNVGQGFLLGKPRLCTLSS